MSAQVYGTAHLYGVSGTLSNATISRASFEETCANVGEVVGETGNVIERRYDDLTVEGTINLIMQTSYSVPSAGTVLTYETVKYEIQKVGRTQEAKGFRVVEVSLKKSEGVTLP